MIIHNILNMKRNFFFAVGLALSLFACDNSHDDMYDPTWMREQYNNQWEMQFGEIDPNHTWNMAKQVKANVDISDWPSGEYIAKIFISAYKYDKLTVLKQFIPYYRLAESESDNWCKTLGDYLPKHQTRYGNNLIISSNRVPKNDFTLFDKRTFDEYNLDFSSQTIISELFHSVFTNLGYIDPLDALDKEE